MAPPPSPSWIILCTNPRVSDAPLADGFALSLQAEAPPRVSFLTVAPWVSPNHKGPLVPFLQCLDAASGLLLVYTGPTYCVLDVRARARPYELPENPSPSYFDDYTEPGVIADPQGAAGAFVLADFHFTVGSGGNEDTLVRYWSRTGRWRAELEASPDEAPDAVPDRAWAFNDVVPHEGRFWWIDSDAGLLTCPAFGDAPPPFLFVPLPDVGADGYEENRLADDFQAKFAAGVVGRRFVQLSGGTFRYVQIRKPKATVGRSPDDGRRRLQLSEDTFVTMRTLRDAATAEWAEPEFRLSFAEMRASESFRAAGLPEDDKDPVFALVHPQNPDVLYFFLGDFLFAFDMRARELIECAPHGLGDNPSSDLVRAWELPPDYAEAIASAPQAAAFRH